MKFAYADPPYLGNGKKHYSPFHENSGEYDSVESHLALLNRLVTDYPDGWALSCNPKDLRWILPALPDDVRVAAWTKTFHQIRVNVSTQYAWEPVVWRGGANIVPRKPMVRDWMACHIGMKKGLPGAKPEAFNRWVLDLLGFDPHRDELDDLFPGSNGMNDTIEKVRNEINTADNADTNG
jgi:hypothetical protein